MIFIIHLLHQEGAVDASLCQILWTLSIIYIGATRSLRNYDIIEKRKQATEPQGRNRLREIWDALFVPICCTVALLTIYFFLIHDYKYMNHCINGYYLVLAVKATHDYQYEFLDNSFGNVEVLAQGRSIFFGFSLNHAVSASFAGYVAVEYLKTGNWMLNNYLAIFVCLTSIEKWM